MQNVGSKPSHVYFNPFGICFILVILSTHIWVKMPWKNNGLIDVLNLLFLAAYCGQL